MAGLSGLSAKEAMLEKPGVVFDLYEIWKQSNGYAQKEEEEWS